LKEKLYGFTQEEIFSQRGRKKIQGLESNTAMSFQISEFLDMLESLEDKVELLEEKIQEHAEPYMQEIEILTSIKGVGVFTAIAIIADIISVNRFRNSKAFTSYLRSAPRVEISNTSKRTLGTNKKGRKLSATLLTQSLNHVLSSSLKLRKWYNRLTEYKKKGLVRTGLRRRIFAEI
jgi:transposase